MKICFSPVIKSRIIFICAMDRLFSSFFHTKGRNTSFSIPVRTDPANSFMLNHFNLPCKGYMVYRAPDRGYIFKNWLYVDIEALQFQLSVNLNKVALKKQSLVELALAVILLTCCFHNRPLERVTPTRYLAFSTNFSLFP